ncbi:MAG: DUF5320 domain-containing protein [Phycisphaerae bacterium]|jgi:hypothetical protein
MPGFDGTGPQGKGPMTGKGMGFCILKESKDKPSQIEGFVGVQGMPVNRYDYGQFYAPAGFIYGRGFDSGLGCGRRFRGGRGRFGY